MNRAVCLLIVALGAPALAQEATPAPEDWPAQTAAALAQPGALESLLGTRFWQDPQGGLVVAEAELDEAAGALRCAVSFVVVGGMREERTQMTCAIDVASGRVTAVGGAVVRGRSQVHAKGVVADGALTIDVEVREVGDTRQQQTRLDWSADRIPWSWAVFFVPVLRAHLPAEAALRIYHDAVQQLDPGQATWTRSADGGAWSGLRPPVAVRATEAGRLVVDLGPAGLLQPIDEVAGRRLQQQPAKTPGPAHPAEPEHAPHPAEPEHPAEAPAPPGD